MIISFDPQSQVPLRNVVEELKRHLGFEDFFIFQINKFFHVKSF